MSFPRSVPVEAAPTDWLPFIISFVAAGALLALARRIVFRATAAHKEGGFAREVTMLLLTFVAGVVVILTLPTDEMRGHVLSFFGIVISAAVALSSTTLLGNGVAGLTLRAIGNFRLNDFVRVGEHFGRVTERGLVHTEIQTEEGMLTTLPNLYIATHPVQVAPRSGAVVAATVSLGYDVPRARIQDVLLLAAGEVGLADPFVSILELGDYSVVYRVSGLCKEVGRLVSTGSRLRGSMLDQLHVAGIEVVSPAVISMRDLAPQEALIPTDTTEAAEQIAPESVLFRKAEAVSVLERMTSTRERLETSLNELGKDAEPERRAQLEARRDALAQAISVQEQLVETFD